MMQVIQGAICSPQEFAENLKLDFSSLIRKKGSIDYLPYAEIIRTLHKTVAYCTYGFEADTEGKIIWYTPNDNAYLKPYLIRTWLDDKMTPTLQVKSPPGFFPVSNMASRHKAVANPDIRQIDNCLRRAIAKEIGVHTGIGLQLWAASDPYDEVDDDAMAFSKAPAKAPNGKVTPIASAPAEGASERLDKAAHAAGLTDHGKDTVAKAVRAEDWVSIPDDKAPKIIQILADADKVALLNAGKNTQGKTINPLPGKGSEAHMNLAEAFNGVSV